MLGKKGPGVAIEGSTFGYHGGGYNKAAAFQRKSDEKTTGLVTNQAEPLFLLLNEAETSPFTIEQMEHLLALLKSNLTSGTSSFLWHTQVRIDDGNFSPIARKGSELGKTIGNARMISVVVYLRKKVLGRSKDQPIIPAHGQPKALGNGSLNVSGNPLSIPTHIHASSSSVTDLSLPSHFGPSPEISAPEPGLRLAPIVLAQDLDLDLLIALRKGTRACTKHPIAKYISYSNLSDNYRAFTTNISKLVVPRNIQEALDEPSWKLAVLRK
ncbi:hypothetical protein CK203_026827 [Vitis vinifera]|uniref:Retrovirus-related Pol polyprotein from transposon RE2 n=1 Tax=Vitis vinifera TaxID=29760 RepID=A0A438IPA6_VITVI|nr:hypothetical protein CK203_026827 [Vitis vinifera]